MDYKYVSKDCMEHINLHDCSVSGYSIFGGDLVLKFEYIYVMHTHPLNTSGISKYTGEACILFEEYSAIDPVYYKYESIPGEKELRYVGNVAVDFLTLLNRFEISSEESKIESDGFYNYKFFGDWWHEQTSQLLYNCNFSEFHIKCRSITVFWNKFEGDAWFGVSHKKGDVATAPDGSGIWILGND